MATIHFPGKALLIWYRFGLYQVKLYYGNYIAFWPFYSGIALGLILIKSISTTIQLAWKP